jgi:2-hydroxychromene-2-carboxylate isomerase
MKHLTFWFDVISPYAYLAFEQLPRALEGSSYSVDYRPVLFAGLLEHWGQKGPAEITPKRAWTYRQMLWIAHTQGVRLDPPASHPFNPLPILRLVLATGPSRRTVEAAFRHVWHGGADASDERRLLALRERLAPSRDPASQAVKDLLRDHTRAAIERGIFGVPTIECEGRMFFGVDALPMLAAAMRDDPWFAPGGSWDRAAALPEGVQRVPRGGAGRAADDGLREGRT